MRRTNFFMVALVVAVLGIAMYGCTSSQPASGPVDQGSEAHSEVMEHADHGHDGHDHGADAGASDMDKMKAELAKLPEADRMAAEKQHMCPVSGEMLGVMGAPLKVAVKGQDVWLCCEGCKEKLLANPDEFLAKLPK